MNNLILFLILFAVCGLSLSQTGVCDRTASFVTYYQQYVQTSRETCTRSWLLRRCRTIYFEQSQTRTRSNYYTVFGCCNGYEQIGPQQKCSPVCRDCDSNHICTAPNTCVCPSGWRGHDCSEPICNNCDSNHVCTAPDTCVCPTGWRGRDCSEPICNNCDSNHICTAPNTCVCPSGWRGHDCSEPICNNCDSNHVCTAPDTCVCPTGWRGRDCSEPICNNCDSNQICTAPNTCVCPSGWRGRDCSEPICYNCDSNHVCTAPNICVCPSGWRGGDCSEPICYNCDSNHVCTAPGTCVCPTGWRGRDCSEPICNNCDSNQICTAPNTCVCPSGWRGRDCSEDINECEDSTTCEQNCANSEGSYSCSCNTGYTLTNDRHGCLAPPQNVFLRATGPTSLRIYWSPPVLDQSDGSPRRYKISCSALSSGAIPDYTPHYNYRQYDLNNLIPCTNYTCCVAAETTNGISSDSCDTNKTLNDRPKNYPHNIGVTNISTSALQITWDPPPMPHCAIIAYTIYIRYDNDSRNEISVDATRRTYVLENLSPHQLVYMQMSASTLAGEGPVSATTHYRTSQAVPSAVTALKVSPQSPYQIQVSWKPPVTPNGIITGYEITVSNNEFNYSNTVSVSANTLSKIISDGIKPFIPYLVEVTAHTHAGQGEIEEQIVFTQEGAPSEAPVITTLLRENADTAYLSWNTLTLEELRGFLHRYEVVYSETAQNQCNDSEPGINNTLLVETSNVTIRALDPLAKYCVGVAASTVAGVGNYSLKPLSLYENNIFQVHFHGVRNCLHWMNRTLLQMISDALSEQLSQICDCHIPTSHIGLLQTTCYPDHPNTMVFQGMMVSMNEWSVTEMMEDLARWVSTAPHIVIEGVQLIADKDCSVELQLEDAKCVKKANVKKTSQFSFIPIVAAVGIIVLLAVLILLTTCGILVRRKKSKKDLQIKEDSVQYTTLGTKKHDEGFITLLQGKKSEDPTPYAVGANASQSGSKHKATDKKREDPIPYAVGLQSRRKATANKREDMYTSMPTNEMPTPYAVGSQSRCKTTAKRGEELSSPVPKKEDPTPYAVGQQIRCKAASKKGPMFPPPVPYSMKLHNDGKYDTAGGMSAQQSAGDEESPYYVKKKPTIPPPVPYSMKPHDDGKQKCTSGLGTKHRAGEFESPLSTKKRPMLPPSVPYKMKPRIAEKQDDIRGMGTNDQARYESSLSAKKGSAASTSDTPTELPRGFYEKLSRNIAYGMLQKSHAT